MSSPRFAIGAALAALTVTGCLFPEYTFDEQPGGAGQGAGGAAGAGPTTGGRGGAGGSGGLGGQGGMPPSEDCFVAGDEDGDELSDCADPDCAPDVECVDAIPVGWGSLGYVALFHGTPGLDPACPAGASTSTYAGHANLTNTSASCSACGCDAPVWASCELTDHDAIGAGLQGLFTRNVPCATMVAGGITELTVPSGWNGMCSALNTAPGGQTCGMSPDPVGGCNTSVSSQAAKPVNGTCSPNGGQPNGGTPTWLEDTKACKADAGLGGCSGGQSCVPRPTTPYEGRVCVAKAGDQACPTGFDQKTLSFADFDDTRDCTPCSCDAATGGTCKITTTLYGTAGCGGTALATVESGKCADLSMNPTVAGRSSTITTPPAGGNCGSSGGGVATGSVTTVDPTTFCCLP